MSGLTEYEEARVALHAAQNKLLQAMAAECVTETLAGHISAGGLRCHQCDFFLWGACTLRDQVKS